MAEETQTTVAAAEVVVVSDVPVAEKPEEPAVSDVPVAEKPEEPVKPVAAEAAVAAAEEKEEKKIAESASFKEETNVVGELPDPQKKALAELKQLVQEALNKHEFTAPPPPPAPKEEEKPAAAAAAVEEPVKAAEEETPKPAEEEAPKPCEEPVPAETETKEETKSTPEPEPEQPSEPVVVAEAVAKIEEAAVVVDEDGAKTVEAIEETIVAAVVPAPTPEAAAVEEPSPAVVEEAAPILPPEEVSIWGIPLLADERSDVVLLKFLRARDFKVKEAFAMLKSVVAWRKEFAIDALMEEDLSSEEHEKVVYMHGVDKEGHPVCYNAFDQNTFSDEEKRTKFLRWRIQFLEKSIRKLDFTPDGVCTIFHVYDIKNFPGLVLRRELASLQLFQDNYPEFIARQVFVNVPWWYLAFYRMISPFFTQRTKSKFVFAGPSKTAESLFKYIAPELVPVQYGGLSKEEAEQEFTTSDSIKEEIVKPSAKHTIEFPVSEACTLVWEARVVGWDVSYGAEFVPSAEDGYTVIVQKSRKISPADETVIGGCFKIGEAGKVVLTFDNQTSKKKKVFYRSKTKSSE